MTTSSALTVAANWHTLEGLTELHPATREVYAALAAEMPKKVDDTTYEVALRKDAKFSDGSAVTADDVVFSFTRVLDPANKSLYSQFLPFIDKVEAKDAGTVTIKLKYAFSLVAERLSVVKIVPKAVVEADAKKFDMNPRRKRSVQDDRQRRRQPEARLRAQRQVQRSSPGAGQVHDLAGPA